MGTMTAGRESLTLERKHLAKRAGEPEATNRWDLIQDRSNWRTVLSTNGEASIAELMPAATRLCRGTLESEDLVSEAFERLIQLWDSGRGPQHGVHGYLVNSMRNRVIDELRSPRSAVVNIPDGYDQASTIGNPERELELKELRDVLNTALRRLPEFSRRVLVEKYVRERKVSEIAAMLDTTASIVSQRIYRAKQTLKQILLEDPRVGGDIRNGDFPAVLGRA
jgi:RNA polymerase sigma factor (sigma-70 family)